MTMKATFTEPVTAVLDDAHIGHIRGAFGTILQDDIAPRTTWKHRLTTLLAILGPGLIVMVGDNDAGAFATYGQAGQNYGTTLLWTLALLIPVLYVNQEMVLRLGAVTGVGHARLIFARFGKFWGAFSVIDLFLLNSLTIVTEFIGISLALDYLGLDKTLGVIVSAALVMIAVSTGDFRRFERFAMVLVGASLLLVPLYFMVHPPLAQVARDFVVPQMPQDGKLADVMLLVIGIVGTTVAPWQLFFQQSYVIDKRITPRFIKYERLDLWIGIALVIVGAVAIMAFTAATFAGRTEFGNFTDAGGIAAGLDKYVGKAAGAMFAIALIDAALIGASAVSLSTAYAIGDTFSARHSLHRKVTDAKGFYAVYCALIVVAVAVVLTPGSPLGLMTLAVQVLAGVLLPSSLGEHALAELLHRRRHCRAGDPVGHPHRLGAVPRRHQRAGDPRHPRRGRRYRRDRRVGDHGREPNRRQRGANRRGRRRGDFAPRVAHAAARSTAAGEVVARRQDLDGRAAALSCRRRRNGSVPDRHAGDRTAGVVSPGTKGRRAHLAAVRADPVPVGRGERVRTIGRTMRKLRVR